MKTASAIAASLVLSASLVTTPLQAQTVNLAKTSCKEFLASGKEGISIIWAWLYGYYSDQDADPIVDFNKLIAKGQALAGEPTTGSTRLAGRRRQQMEDHLRRDR